MSKAPPAVTKLYCFSPPVMLATLIIEFGGAIYATWRYRLNQVERLIVILLVCLATFQLAEFFICTTASVANFWWARIGHVAISFLPPLGIHLAMTIANKNTRLVPGLYLIAAGYLFYFLLFAGAIESEQCLGNYVVFTAKPHAMPWYGLYYYGYLAVGVGLSMWWSKLATSINVKKALWWVMVSYLSFLVPTTAVNFLHPITLAGIPSIMCGFAVLMAIILLGRVLPLVGTPRRALELGGTGKK